MITFGQMTVLHLPVQYWHFNQGHFIITFFLLTANVPKYPMAPPDIFVSGLACGAEAAAIGPFLFRRISLAVLK